VSSGNQVTKTVAAANGHSICSSFPKWGFGNASLRGNSFSRWGDCVVLAAAAILFEHLYGYGVVEFPNHLNRPLRLVTD